MLDVLIRGGTVVDGSGEPRRRADVGIRRGRVAVVGSTDESAKHTIDASGKIVAPGFVDIHTHYDAQVFWDPAVTPSCVHGITTVIGGNCGFSIAPLRPEAGEYLMRMLAQVEGMPLESLRGGVPWDWTSFGDYLARHDRRLALNAGFLVGHSAIRRVVMGERAIGEEATEEELSKMTALLRESLEQGGLGFSSSRAVTHNDLDGRPVPSRHASRDELIALARCVRHHPGTTLEFIPGVGIFTDEQIDLMTDLSLAAQRPLNWNVLSPSSATVEITRSQLAASDRAAERGARVVALTIPQILRIRINLRSGFVFDVIPGWSDVLALPLEERKEALANSAVRARLASGAASDQLDPFFRRMFEWEEMRVVETMDERNRKWEGRTLRDVAKEQGKSAFDAMLDIALTEDLRTSFAPLIEVAGDDDASWKMRAEAWLDPRTVIGGSDAGAHLDTTDSFAFTSEFLHQGVRKRGLIELEEAVRQITDLPARLYGIRERGRLQAGWHADVVVFDLDRIAVGPVHTRLDLPGGAGRLYAEAEGIDHVFVNGVEIVREGQFQHVFPGTVLRSGRDTETVDLTGVH